MTEECVLHIDGNESIVKQGVSRFHSLQSCTHVNCGNGVDKFYPYVGFERIGYHLHKWFLTVFAIRLCVFVENIIRFRGIK